MPCSHQENRILLDQSLNPCNFRAAEATTSQQANRFEPEFRTFSPLHMHVERFISIGRVKEEPVWPHAKNGWQTIPVYPANAISWSWTIPLNGIDASGSSGLKSYVPGLNGWESAS